MCMCDRGKLPSPRIDVVVAVVRFVLVVAADLGSGG